MKRTICTEYNDTEFKELVASAVKEVLEQSLSQFIPRLANPTPNQLSDRLLSRKEACKSLRISLPTLAKLQKEGKIKVVIIGGSYKYSNKHIQEVMNGSKT